MSPLLRARTQSNGSQIAWKAWQAVQSASTLSSAICRHQPLMSCSRYSTSQAAAAEVNAQDPMSPTTDIEENYWQRVPIWKDVSKKDFINYQWQVRRRVSVPKGYFHEQQTLTTL
jgi:hypothetical protein